MQAGNMGGGERGGGKKPSGREKLQFSVCDVSSDDFKKTWLMLKELHDKELRRLQAKLASLRKERLADGRWTGSTAKIKELTAQQKVLSSTIQNLRDQLNAKTCERCLLNESYRNTLQQEFYDIQQQNLHFIAQLTEERNRLREENQKLSAELKRNLQHLPPSFSSSDDEVFIPCTQRSVPVFSVREPSPGTHVYLPVRLIKQSNTEEMKTGRKERPRSPKFSIPFYSQDLFEDRETSPEQPYPNSSKPGTESSTNQKSPAGFPLTSIVGPQKGQGFQDVSNHEDQLGQPKRKQIFTQRTSTQRTTTQKCETQIDFSWSLSSISTTGNPTTQVVSETSEENMPDYKGSSFPPFTQSKEKPSLNVFPFDYTVRSSGKKSKSGITQYNIGFSVRDCSYPIPFTEQSTGKKNVNESTDKEHDANKPLGDTQSFISGSAIKRKARTQTEKEGK